MKAQFLLVPATALVAVAAPVYAKVYLSIEQAQQLMFPGATLIQQPLTLTAGQVHAIEKASHTDVLSRQLRLWKVSTGGWFIIDQVVGKHAFIPIALGLDGTGAVKSIEILEYREAFGSEVRNPKWLAQFDGKRNGATLTLTRDIQNISGATLSSKHITDGVRRLLATYALAIAPH
ncbi:FMN-binding protein [Dyella sp. A6]|uniref:FMN-binding protein n=1 Tax=Dyella aluminiiresistens TaxID=3069105 RepID=UPI002E78C9C5|nr:FMN-binding protein [Dyella sp. A6]